MCFIKKEERKVTRKLDAKRKKTKTETWEGSDADAVKQTMGRKVIKEPIKVETDCTGEVGRQQKVWQKRCNNRKVQECKGKKKKNTKRAEQKLEKAG